MRKNTMHRNGSAVTGAGARAESGALQGRASIGDALVTGIRNDGDGGGRNRRKAIGES